jgi:uncharacterized protein YdaT
MPFSGKDFASKHNKKLNPQAAGRAADMANAMIERGVDEGTAIATANKHGNRVNRSPIFKEQRKRSREHA